MVEVWPPLKERGKGKKKKKSGIEASETAAHFFRVLEPNSLLEESPAYQERRVKGGTKVAAYVVDMFVVIFQSSCQNYLTFEMYLLSFIYL